MTRVLLTLLLISSVSFGQIKINGFGKLKLGMSLDSIPELKDICKYDRNIDSQYEKLFDGHNLFDKLTKEQELIQEKLKKNSECYSNGFGSYEYIRDTINFGGINTTIDDNIRKIPIDKRLRVFYLKYIKIAEDIILWDVELRFFNNKLYYVETSTLLNELISAKYGKPKVNDVLKKVVYKNGYGATFVKYNRSIDYFWLTHPNIKLECHKFDGYDYEGEPVNNSYTTIYDVKTKKIIDDLLISMSKKKEIEKKNNLINQSKGF